MGGYVVQVSPETQSCFKPKDLLRLLSTEAVEMPILEDRDIDDRSKANWFTKSVALLQVGWFLLQLLARALGNLPVTTLELYTLGIVICAVFTYSAYWHKPFDVQRPVVLKALKTETVWPESVDRVSLPYHSNIQPIGRWVWSISLCSLFTASHLLGWNYDFYTNTEQWLWRAGSICCFALPLATVCTLHLPDSSYKDFGAVILTMLYFLVRVALFVEMFVALRSVPIGVYQTPEWTNYVPSFG